MNIKIIVLANPMIPKISWDRFFVLPFTSLNLNSFKILQVFGVYLFALSGFTIISDVLHLEQSKKKGLAAVLIGTILPALVYLIFTISVLSVSGSSVSTDALSGMVGKISPLALTLLFSLGILTITTAFLGLGNVLKNMFEKDFNTPHCWAWFFTVYPPLVGYLFLEGRFLEILGIIGLASTIILMFIVGLIWRKMKLKVQS